MRQQIFGLLFCGNISRKSGHKCFFIIFRRMADTEANFDELARAYMELKERKSRGNIDSDAFDSFITGVPVKSEVKKELEDYNGKFNVNFRIKKAF